MNSKFQKIVEGLQESLRDDYIVEEDSLRLKWEQQHEDDPRNFLAEVGDYLWKVEKVADGWMAELWFPRRGGAMYLRQRGRSLTPTWTRGGVWDTKEEAQAAAEGYDVSQAERYGRGVSKEEWEKREKERIPEE